MFTASDLARALEREQAAALDARAVLNLSLTLNDACALATPRSPTRRRAGDRTGSVVIGIAASVSPALYRLGHFAPLSAAEVAVIREAESRGFAIRARREVMREGEEIGESRLIVQGWVARIRLLSDGRRQLINYLLPGDLIGWCSHARPLASSTVIAITDAVLARAPAAEPGSALCEAYAVSRAWEEAYLCGQVLRLGRLNAQERIADLMLELHERLDLAGLVTRGGFDLPLTQEALADTLGLTSVHINRMLQLMRREGDIVWRTGRLTLPDPAALSAKIGRVPVRVTAQGS